MRSPFASGPITLGRAHGRLGSSLALAALLSGLLGAPARATDISALPFTITVPGTYNLTADLEDNTLTGGIRILADDVVLDLGGHTISGTQATGGIVLVGVSRVTVRNGAVAGFSPTVYLENASDNIVEGLTVSNTNGGGISLAPGSNGSNRNTIQDNTFMQCGAGGVFVSYSSDNVFQRNTIINCGWGFRLTSASKNHLKDNSISNGTATGIELGDSHGNHLQHNTVSNSTTIYNGIDLEASNGNFLQDNNSSNNGGGGHGIILGSTSNENTLQGNTTSGNGGVGIYLGSNDNTVKNNTANGNGSDGIFVQSCSGNTLRKNDAFNNNALNIGASDLSDTTCENTWKNNNFGTSNGVCIQ